MSFACTYLSLCSFLLYVFMNLYSFIILYYILTVHICTGLCIRRPNQYNGRDITDTLPPASPSQVSGILIFGISKML